MSSLPVAATAPRPYPLRAFWAPIRALIRKPSGAIGLGGVLFFVILCYVGPLFIPAPPTNVDQTRQGPTLANPLGTDNSGRSILVLLIRGGQEVISTGLLAAVLTGLLGVILGALAAYVGGLFDTVVVGVANFFLVIPTFTLLTVLSTIIRLDNVLLLGVLLATFNWPLLARVVRAQVLSLRERDYVEAAVSLGLTTRHIIALEILPNMASYIIVNLIFSFTNAIYALIGLIFLGFVPINTRNPNWGVVINISNNQGAINNPDNTWWILGPVLAIAFLQWFMFTLARSIEDAFNPRLRAEG
jgi:peptide/nickel transport system permease protein